MIVVCQCRFILVSKKKKKYHLGSDADNGGDCACMGARSTWKISVSSSQFSYKLETTVKKIKTLKRD